MCRTPNPFCNQNLPKGTIPPFVVKKYRDPNPPPLAPFAENAPITPLSCPESVQFARKVPRIWGKIGTPYRLGL